jgi:hypothetical protein
MPILSWISAGLFVGALVLILPAVSGMANGSNLIGLAIMFGTMLLITSVRRIALSRVAFI